MHPSFAWTASILGALLAVGVASPVRAGDECTPDEEADCAGNAAIDLEPLTALPDDTYGGRAGGLYPDGSNAPPADHACAGQTAADAIAPLDPDGSPATDGRVVLFSIGMSNTTAEFSRFRELLADPPAPLHAALRVVDGAQGGRAVDSWIPGGAMYEDTWATALSRLELQGYGGEPGLVPAQVQAVWIKQAFAGPGSLPDDVCPKPPCNEFPGHADALRDALAILVDEAAMRFPNLRIVYVSSRTSAYVLYPDDGMYLLNPEPYAFESGFAVKWLVEQRMGAAGPWVSWGPYVWAHGGCNDDGFCWCCDDTRSDPAAMPDYTHPSETGMTAVGNALVQHFTTDPTAVPWFLAEPGEVADACEVGGSSSGDDSGGATGSDTLDGPGSSGGGGTTTTGSTTPADATADEGSGEGATEGGGGGCGCSSRLRDATWTLAALVLAARRRRGRAHG